VLIVSAELNKESAGAVASFGMLLRESPHQGTTTLGSVLELAEEGPGADAHGYRSEFLELVRKARGLRRL
jgi:Ca-activated chloride channel family protein